MGHRCVLSMALILTAMGGGVASAATKVQLQNSLDQPIRLFVSAGEGRCHEKQFQNTYSVARGDAVIIEAGKSSVCYVWSFSPNPLEAPLGGAEVPSSAATVAVGKSDFLAVPFEEVASGGAALGGAKQQGTELLVGSRASHGWLSGGGPALGGGQHLEKSLASWNDPLSRQSKTDCVNEAWGKIPFDGEWRTCVGWRTEWRCLHNEYVLVIEGPEASDLKTATEQCLAVAGVAGAIAAVVPGAQPGALEAAVGAFKVCMGTKLVEFKDSISVRIDTRGGWTGWGGC